MVGAGAGDEDPARSKHLERTEIEFLVSAQRSVQIALALGEGRRIEDDGVVAAVRVGIVLQQVEGVGLDPFNLPWFSVAFWSATSSAGRELSTPGHLRADLREVEREAALIAENVERFSVGVAAAAA